MKRSTGDGQALSRLAHYASVPAQVHLRRMTVRDALDKLERYLNEAALAGLPRVWIVHGKGTGTLRRAVLDYISNHPLVAGHEPAAPDEGGGGATMARLSGG